MTTEQVVALGLKTIEPIRALGEFQKAIDKAVSTSVRLCRRRPAEEN